MKRIPGRDGGSNLSPAYSTALEDLSRQQTERRNRPQSLMSGAQNLGFPSLSDIYNSLPSGTGFGTPIYMGNGNVSMGGQGSAKDLIFEPARKAVRRAVGDVTAIPKVGEPSSSYTADKIREQGVVLGGLGAVADYSTLASAVVPAIKASMPKPMAPATPYVYGVHVSPNPNLSVISPRTAGSAQWAAGDAMAGSSYMWDARSPRLQDIFTNPQMNRNAADVFADVAAPDSYAYITRAPANTVFQDANVLGSPALRVAGQQEILQRVPFTAADLAEALAARNIVPRTATADALEAAYRGLNPVVKADVANRPMQLAEEALRRTIATGPNPYMAKNYPGLFDLNPNLSLPELLRNPDARRYFDEYVNRRGQ